MLMTERVYQDKRRTFSLVGQIDKYFPYLVLIPSTSILVLVVGYPILQTFILSLQEVRLGDLSGYWVGLGNYIWAFSEPRFWNVLVNTLYFTVGTLVIELVVAIPVSLVLSQKFKGVRLFRGIVLLPYLLASVVVATIWKWSLNDVYGVVNWVLMGIGILDEPVSWMTNRGTAMPIIILASAWREIPVVALILVAGLQSIRDEIYEAASIDGTNAWQGFWLITMPLLKPYIFLSLILRTTFAVREFDLVWLITGGGPAGSTELISTFAYKEAFTVFEAGYASALSVILLLFTFSITVVYVKMLMK